MHNMPHASTLQDFFCPSSKGWPPFIRVNPVLNWAYCDIWAHLRAIGAKFCHLYLEGYTSLGSVKDTAPNSSLRRADGSYAPAFMLNGTLPLVPLQPRCFFRLYCVLTVSLTAPRAHTPPPPSIHK